MKELGLLLRAQARGRWRSGLGLAVLVGVIGGAIIATLAGARRTETAYARFLERTRAFDSITTNGTSPDNLNRQFDFDEVAALPQVLDAARVYYYFVSGSTASGQRITASDIAPFASPDGKFGTELNKLSVLEGRLPRGDHEVAATLVAADWLDLSVGTTIHMQLTGPDAQSDPAEATSETDFRVVGIIVMESGFPPKTAGLPPPVILSEEYARSHPDAAQIFAVRLHRGFDDAAAFEQQLTRLAGGEPIVTANRSELSAIERTLSVEATALRLFAGLVTIAATVVLGQVVVHQALMRSTDHHVLRALGITDAQLRRIEVVWGALTALVAASLAAVVAVALSPLTPVGLARKAELQPGVELNLAYLGAGSGMLFAMVVGLGAMASRLSTRRWASPSHAEVQADQPSRVASALGRAGLSSPVTSGVRMALEPGRGRSTVPVRSTILSATFAVAMVVAVLGFSASLRELLDDPSLYGWNWDVQIGDSFAPALDEEADRLLQHPAVDALALGTTVRVDIDGTQVDALATESTKGLIEPTVIEGRPPRAAGEILLGTRTLRDLGVELGDTVELRLGDRAIRVAVVGRGVLAEGSGTARLGKGAALTFEGIRALQPDAVANVVLVRVHPGSEGDALLADLVDEQVASIYLPEKPSDLADLERVGGLPFALATLLGTLSVATLAYALVSSVRRRRRELAILKVLGFVRGQISAAVAWQSSVVAGIAVALGLPLGMAIGQLAWRAFADQLGVPPRPITPVLALALVVPAAFLLANLTAALPARWASRTQSSSALRAE